MLVQIFFVMNLRASDSPSDPVLDLRETTAEPTQVRLDPRANARREVAVCEMMVASLLEVFWQFFFPWEKWGNDPS